MQKYFVRGFEWVHWKNLEVHPEARVPIAEEDAAALRASVEDNGLIQPLLVISREEKAETRQDAASPKGAAPKGKKGKKAKAADAAPATPEEPPEKKWWIVDGANRFKVHQKGVADLFPCVVIELHAGASVRDLALECASVGRSRSAGQRIMVYLERHKEKVLETAEKGQELSKGGRSPFAVSRDTATESTEFSSEAISKALGVSKVDTLLAIDLLKSHERREGLEKRTGPLVETGKKLEEGSAELAAIDEAWAGVLAGTMPIRRWKAAVGGKAATKGVGRAATNVVACAIECAKKFKTFGGARWAEIPMEDRVLVLDAFRKVLDWVPDEVMQMMVAEQEARVQLGRARK